MRAAWESRQIRAISLLPLLLQKQHVRKKNNNNNFVISIFSLTYVCGGFLWCKGDFRLTTLTTWGTHKAPNAAHIPAFASKFIRKQTGSSQPVENEIENSYGGLRRSWISQNTPFSPLFADGSQFNNILWKSGCKPTKKKEKNNTNCPAAGFAIKRML